MRWVLDALYLLAATITAPIWLIRMLRTGKIRTDWSARLAWQTSRLPPRSNRKRVLIHAVSVGEVNAIRNLVGLLIDDFEVVVSSTTDTGLARAQTIWPHRHGSFPAVVRYPLDFSISVDRFLNAIDPDVVALTELEVWPNFTAACTRRNIALCVVNGRLTERSFRRYRRISWLIKRSFARLSFAAVQNDAYANRFIAMGTASDRVHVLGTMKWDTAQVADDVDGADELAQAMSIDRTRPLIVAGSTAPGEHELLHASVPSGVQLLCAPRKPEWFDQAAAVLPGCVRRSQSQKSKPQSGSDRYLLDTIGELRKAYALADIVVIGRSFGTLHGSDMMEPAALGKAIVVGPRFSDFQDVVDALQSAKAIVQTTTQDLPRVLQELLDNRSRREALGRDARQVVMQHQGSTAKHAAMIRSLVVPEH